MRHSVFSRPVQEKMPSFRYSVLALFVALSGSAQAQDWFNPAFLTKDGNEVADLSRFENGSGQLPGVYRVDIWRNDEFVTTSPMRFIAVASQPQSSPASEAVKQDGTGLQPCLTVAWMKRLGVHTENLTALKATDNQEE